MFNIQTILQSKLVSGFVGSLIGVSLAKECDTWMKRIVYFFGGFGFAFYVAAPVATHLGLSDPEAASAVTCVFGILWQPILSKITTALDSFQIPFLGGKAK